MSRVGFGLLVSSTLLFAACSDDGTGDGAPCSSNAECTSGQCVAGQCATPSGVDAGTGGPDGAVMPGPDAGPERRLIRVVVMPGTATLVSTDGARATITFTATSEYSDGTTSVSTPRWTANPVLVGDVGNASGVFTANGFYGGTTTVRATVREGSAEVTGEATLTVRLERTVVAAGTDPNAPSMFAGTPTLDPPSSADIAYPLDGVVMPQNVYPADIQWRNGAPGDVFRVRLTKPSVQVTAYVAYDGANHWLADEPAWRRFAQTDPDASATLEVTRWVASTQTLVDGRTITLRFAPAALSGSIYYWDIAAGRIVRIDDGTATRVQFMPNPQLGCVGCHSVSSSGRYMAGRFGGGENIGGVLDLTRDLTGNPPPTEYPVDANSVRWWFSSWSPDDRRLVVSTDENSARQLRLIDPFAGVYVDPPTGPMPSNATHPAWSPDNTAIAYVSDLNAWGGANTEGSIYVLPVTGPDSFGAPVRINDGSAVPNPMPAGTADSYPTWTPDSQHVIFAHGTSSRSENGQAALYMVRRDGTGLRRLDRASGGVDAIDTFQPRMSPFDSGGYFWVTYLTRRDYGNAQAGTAGTGRQQIWISAIKKNAAPGEDPSEVGYWLPGQNPASMNISAYWAPRACRADGDSCTVASECCGGDCRPDANGNPVCAPGPGAMCREIGESCTLSSDCCDGNLCSPTGLCGNF